MKKSLCALTLGISLLLATSSALSQAAREATIEPETKARIVLQTPLNSKLSEVDDTIVAVLYEPIFVNGQLVLPRGTEFHGRVTSVTPAKRPQKNGKLGIMFDRVALSWGQEPVAISFTSLDDWDKGEKMKTDDEGKVQGNRRGKDTAENVMTGGAIGSAGAGVLILSGGGLGAGAAAIGGGMLTGLLLTKGGEVAVQPGAMFRIKFDKPLTLPVAQQSGAMPQPIRQPEAAKPEPEKKP
jgi:hypothetical protein